MSPAAEAMPSRMQLARLGFAELSETLALLSRECDAHNWALSILDRLRTAADPDAALQQLLDLAERCPDLTQADDHALDRLILLLGGSTGLGDFLLRSPEELAWFIAHEEVPLAREAYIASIADAAAVIDDADTPETRANRLRLRYRRHLTQVAVWDLSADDPREVFERVGQALSDLADAAFEAALQIGTAACRPQFGDLVDQVRVAVIAMGKTGAREVNYISDVDVIYVAEPVGDTDPSRALTAATRIVQSAVRAISATGREPGLWEVDANLRPEGKDGALVRTLASHEAYYARWAKEWEFQALLKARAMAGDAQLGLDYIRSIRPLVWQSASRPNFVESVQAMRQRVTDNIPADQVDVQLKLGPGGLRDVEFTVQLLQLVHGQHDERLRGRATLESLRALSAGGYVGRREADEFADDYRTLRVLEHRLQLRQMRRTHLMPRDDADLRVLARASKLAAGGPDLAALWQRTRRSARELHTRLFFSPLLATVAALPGEDFQLTTSRATDRLRAIGYRDPDGALQRITSLTSGVSRRAEIQRHLLPLMLELFAEGSDPDAGLLSFTRISESIGDAYWYLRMLRDSPVAAQRLAQVLSCSRFIGDSLASQPEAAQWFENDDGVAPRTFEMLHTEMAAVVRRHPAQDPRVVPLLQQLRRREVLRLAIWAVINDIPVEQVSRGLSTISRALLEALLLWIDPVTTHGVRFAVIGLGRFGGGELGFASDLDVMYVYEPVRDNADVRALAQQLAKAAHDFVMPVDLDLDLRPEGRKGAIAKTISALSTYYQRWAQTWERQALVRAAPVAGDTELLDQAMAVIDQVRWGAPPDLMQEREIKRLKARMESERLPRGVDPSRHVKLGRGSLTDVEWVIQLEQLRHAHADVSLRTSNTLTALAALTASGILTGEDAETLRTAWLLASRVRDANMLATGKPSDVLAESGAALEPTARLLGYAAGTSAALENDYLRATRRSRRVFERLFYGE